jgi:hypothetical protein
VSKIQRRQRRSKRLRKSLASGLGEVCLPNEVWRLWTGGTPSNRLLEEQKLEDLFLWNRFEISATLIGPQALTISSSPERKVSLSKQARKGLEAFAQLFPEWPNSPYMRIPQPERKR